MSPPTASLFLLIIACPPHHDLTVLFPTCLFFPVVLPASVPAFLRRSFPALACRGLRGGSQLSSRAVVWPGGTVTRQCSLRRPERLHSTPRAPPSHRRFLLQTFFFHVKFTKQYHSSSGYRPLTLGVAPCPGTGTKAQAARKVVRWVREERVVKGSRAPCLEKFPRGSFLPLGQSSSFMCPSHPEKQVVTPVPIGYNSDAFFA